MFDEMLSMPGEAMDALANTDKGHKIIDHVGAVTGRLYKNLTEVQGLSPEAAANICSSICTAL